MADPNLDNNVRLHIYGDLLARGVAPSVSETAAALSVDHDDVAESYDRLATGRVIVLRPGTHDVIMAAPLSAVPTPYRITLADGRSHFGNCAWDGLGVLAMLGTDGVVATKCADCNEPLELHVRNGRLEPTDTVIHFGVPAADWWKDVVFT